MLPAILQIVRGQRPVNITIALVEALTNLIQVFINAFGPGGTLAIFMAIGLVSFGWRRYQDYRKDKERDLAIVEMEKAVQRSAQEAREYRIMFFMQNGWTDEQIEKFVVTEEVASPEESRDVLKAKGGKKKPSTLGQIKSRGKRT